ncbi:hypothetical protein [Novosphingobium sp.]|uniref:hypothetical protein n=1 Tax=Novosphingobium sp. TaxID=1874826 RepID=UPI0025E4212D|nr:hypothetical protein [Novosphingobium sp.]
MASLASDVPGQSRDNGPGHSEGFFARLAIVMALTVVAGFSLQVLMSRSTFAAPLRVHVHAVLFMGWVAIFVAQSQLATRGSLALHRRLGWLALGWVVLMVIAAMTVIVAMARNGTVPFFFQPQHFILADPLTLLGFVALTAMAIARRRQTDWHARLHISAMALLTGPAIGRLLPMPLLTPYAFEAAGLGCSLFMIAGMLRDRRRLGAIHPAWWYGLAALAVNLVGAQAIAHSPLGDALYRTVVAGSPGETIPGMEFPLPPGTPLRSGG